MAQTTRETSAIKYICIHHSVTPRDLPLEKSVSSFNNSHKARLHPEANSKGLHVAYHYVIAGDGEKAETRGLNEIGYHASDWDMNVESIGICVTGNFDEEKPSKAQMDTLRKLLRWLCKEFDIDPSFIISHRDVEGVTKSCPGKNLHILMDDIRDSIDAAMNISPWAEEAWEFCLDHEILSDQSMPQSNLTKEEMAVMLHRYHKSQS